MGKSVFLELKHISKDFPGVKALSEINLNVEKGEVHAIVGENGAGKSTLIKILAGVLQPNAGGEILIEGNPVAMSNALVSASQGISVIFQDFSLFPNLSVAENLWMNVQIAEKKKTVNWKENQKSAQQALDEVKLDVDLNMPVEKLSIAKQQIVAIARALVMNAKLVIMDEPTATLSGGEVKHLFTIIDQLKNKGISVIFISHKLDEVFTVADRITVLRDGQYIGTYGKAELTEKQLISYMVGREIEETSYDSVYTDEVVLEVKHLSKKKNYKDINFKVRRGEVLAITGLVGSGRSEVITSIFGVNKPDSGEILLEGKPVTINSTAVATDLGIALVPENRQTEGLIMRHSMSQNIVSTVLKKVIGKFGLISQEKEQAYASEYIEKMDIRPALPDILAMNMSGGNQQKVVLSKWLATNPKVLMIDEPTNGIDIGAKAEIHKLIRRLASEGMAVIMVSSELPEVLSVSDTVIVMRNGRIVDKVVTNTATQESIMEKALTGEPVVEK